MKTTENWSLKICYWLLAMAFIGCSPRRAQAQFSPVPIRFSGDSSIRYNPSVTDSNTSQALQFVRGDFVTFDVGLFDRGVFRSNTMSQFTNATLGIFTNQNDDTATAMMLAIVTNNPGTNGWNTNCSLAAWTNNSASTFTNWNLEFNFSSTATAINLNGQAAQGYWLRLFCDTTDSPPRTVTYMEGPITIYDGPIATIITPPGFAWLRYGTVNGSTVPEIYDPVSGFFYTLEIDTVAGIRTLSLGDTPISP